MFTETNWVAPARSMFWSTVGGLAATLVTRLIRRRAPLWPARPSWLVSYAFIGAAGFFVANTWFDAPTEGGLWGGLFLVYIMDSLICQFLLRRNSN